MNTIHEEMPNSESDGAVVISIDVDNDNDTESRIGGASSPPDSPIVFSMGQNGKFGHENRAYSNSEEFNMQEYYRRKDSTVSERSLPDSETVERIPKADHYRLPVANAQDTMPTRPTLLELHAAGLERFGMSSVSFEDGKDGYEVSFSYLA